MLSHARSRESYHPLIVDDGSLRETDSSPHPPSGRDDPADATADPDSGVTVEDHSPCRWTIGWRTPTVIILCYLIALVIAIAHFVYYRSLNNRLVEVTIPQEWNNRISTALVHLFVWTLTGSTSLTFTQLLWASVRKKPLKMSVIDALYSVTSMPSNLLSVESIKSAPLLWSFGLMFPAIPFAMVFPPGALIVAPLPVHNSTMMEVPTLDLDFRGNGTVVSLLENAWFSTGSDGEYRLAYPAVTSVARRVLLNGTYIRQDSPCGSNCSYTLEFLAPSWQCSEGGATDLEQKVFSQYQNETTTISAHSDWNRGEANFLSGDYSSNDTFLGKSAEYYVTDVEFWNRPSDQSHRVTCVCFFSTYETNFTFVNNVESVETRVTAHQPLNASYLSMGEAFYYVFTEPDNFYDVVIPGNFTTQGPSGPVVTHVDALFRGFQARAIHDGLSGVLGGAISGYDTEDMMISHTTIHESPFAAITFHPAENQHEILFTLNPSILETLMQDVTISLLSSGNQHANTTVRQTFYLNGYVFSEPAALLVPYAATLAISLVFTVLGLVALVRNGVSATPGSFLQVLCTTAGGVRVNELAARACLGGDENIPAELKDLKVRFGELRRSSRQMHEGHRVAAFGTAAETSELVRGGYYG